MEKYIEIELKYQIIDENQIQEFLKKFFFVSKERVVDVYLDTKEGDLYKKGIFIRVRNNKILDFKYNLEDLSNLNKVSMHEQCDEYSFPLPLTNDSIKVVNQNCRILGLIGIFNPDLEELKVKNNLINSVVIDKIRKNFRDKELKYSFDDVKRLGKFFEIEKHGREGEDFEKAKGEIRKRVKNLKLKLITAGYCEAYWRKYDFNLYLQGRYLFTEDYKKYRLKH
jgi:adenylate cyclase class IV